MGSHVIGSLLANRADVNHQGGQTTVSRRDFARSLFGVAAGVAGLRLPSEALGIAVVLPSLSSTFEKGVRMSVEESERSAALFGKRLVVHRATVANAVALPVQFVIACVNDSQVKQLSAACDRRGITLFNCGSRADALRRTLCSPRTFHIEASDAMYASALHQSHAKRVALWDSTLEKYGAAQLNDRFRSFAHEQMDGSAWAGWVAVKIAWESFLRGASPLVDLQFDGHKGAPLSFRSWDHQLRQPLYAVGEKVTDIPDIGKSNLPERELLDTLGDPKGAQTCRRS
jgi:hypothetical protein